MAEEARQWRFILRLMYEVVDSYPGEFWLTLLVFALVHKVLRLTSYDAFECGHEDSMSWSRLASIAKIDSRAF